MKWQQPMYEVVVISLKGTLGPFIFILYLEINLL